jgi:hypothetical protein
MIFKHICAAILAIHGATALPPSPVEAAAAAVPTLINGWYFIRAVAAPNYHKYLQSKPTASSSTAYLDAAEGAGQFNIIDGQLVYYTGSSELYLHVEQPTDLTQRKLQTWFETGKNTFGTFAFQGDAVTWSVSQITRPNTAAWFVCEDQELFINTGAYGYQTPAGCADQTVSFQFFEGKCHNIKI